MNRRQLIKRGMFGGVVAALGLTKENAAESPKAGRDIEVATSIHVKFDYDKPGFKFVTLATR